MTEEACSRVKCVLCTCRELMYDVCKERVLLLFRSISLCVFSIERKSHVEAVKPHLMGIYMFVPELSGLCARLIVDLLADHPRHTTVTLILVSIHVMKVKVNACRADVVHIIIRLLVLIDDTLLCRHGVSPVADIIHDLRKIISLGCIQERLEFESCRIVPLPFAVSAIQIGSVRISLHL